MSHIILFDWDKVDHNHEEYVSIQSIESCSDERINVEIYDPISNWNVFHVDWKEKQKHLNGKYPEQREYLESIKYCQSLILFFPFSSKCFVIINPWKTLKYGLILDFIFNFDHIRNIWFRMFEIKKLFFLDDFRLWFLFRLFDRLFYSVLGWFLSVVIIFCLINYSDWVWNFNFLTSNQFVIKRAFFQRLR